MQRRTFLKLLGGTAAATVAAPIITPATGPLYIPAERLDYGVPRQIVTAQAMPLGEPSLAPFIEPVRQSAWATGTAVPMTLLWDEFRPPHWQQFGREKVPAGTTLLVDESTARRWIKYGVAAAAPSAPVAFQNESAKRLAEKKQREEFAFRASDGWTWPDSDDTRPSVPAAVQPRMNRADSQAAWDAMIARAERKARQSSVMLDWWDA